MDKAAWSQEIALHTDLFTQLAHQLPAALTATQNALRQRLAA